MGVFFSQFFMQDATRYSVLTQAHMAPYRMAPHEGGHAVVLVQCDPQSLAFLNNWGNQWGNNANLSFENPSVLKVDGASEWARMCFYDVHFYEAEWAFGAKQAYENKVSKKTRDLADRH